MALKDIIQMPDPRLKKPSRKVSHVDDNLRELVADMDETMREYDGVGLAAVQVGVHKRLVLVCVPYVVEESLDPEDAKAILESDDEDAKQGIFEITEKNMKNPDAEPYVRYVRRRLEWPESTVYINPRILEKEGLVIDDEGCLSDMGYHAKVERSRKVRVVAQDMDMNQFEKLVTGFEARCIQHELDHLEGIVYHDRMIEGTRCPMKGEGEGGAEGVEEGMDESGDMDEGDEVGGG